jgi:hypothetical protein
MRLVSSHGEIVLGRCKSTNLCPYCQVLYAVETAEMLELDAMTDAPTVWGVLTSREHLTRKEFNEHLRTIRQRMKREGWSVEWFVQIEFQKRGALHGNLLVKLHAELAEAWWARFVELWCERVDALPVGQWLGAIGSAVAVSRYLQKTLRHGLKREQAPPLGWSGHRTSHTRGYFAGGTAPARARARESLSRRRALGRASAAGLSAHDAELAVVESMRLAAATTWFLANERGVRVAARSHDEDLQWRLWLARRTDPTFAARAEESALASKSDAARLAYVHRRDVERQAQLAETLAWLAARRKAALEAVQCHLFPPEFERLRDRPGVA